MRADVREHLEAENAYTAAMLAGDRGAAGADVRGDEGAHQGGRRLRARRPTAPSDYYRRYEIGRPASASMLRRPRGGRRGRGGAAGRGGALAKGKRLLSRSARAEHSPDHALYAWAEDEQGSEYYRIHVQGPGRPARSCPAPIESAYGDFCFSPDSAWLFWIWRDENAPARQGLPPPGARRRRRAGLRGAGRGHVPRRRRRPPTAATS